MKVERPQTLNAALALAFLDKTHQTLDPSARLPAPAKLLADAETFEQEFSRMPVDDDESPNDDSEDDKSRATPFELLHTPLHPSVQVTEVPVYQGIPQLVVETLQQLYVSDGKSSRRQVSMTLAEDVLPGVRVSVFEDGGRVVAEFACAVEQSRECLCQCAGPLASGLADRLNRETRICVRADDPEDPCAVEAEASPTRGASRSGEEASLANMQGRDHDV